LDQVSKLQVLIDLGLTGKQAKVYLALVSLGPSKVLTVSRLSNVARSDVYPTLIKLQQRGLIEKVLKNPVEYRAIPLNKGLSFLLEETTKRYQKISAETSMLHHMIELEKPNNAGHKDNPQFVSISKGKTVVAKLREALEKTNKSFDVVLSWKRFSSGLSDTFAETIENVWMRKVKTRFIVECPFKNKTSMDLIRYCRKHPSCQIRFIRFLPRTIFGIYDQKETFITEDPKTHLPDSPALWSTNSSLIALVQDHFEIQWQAAIEELNF
jgi:sugar-specific transcriptional regulator TrmB